MLKIKIAKHRLLLLLAATLLTVLLAIISLTNVCNLEAVTIDGELVEDWNTTTLLHEGRSILDQPVDSVVAEILSRKGVYKVDLSYQLPDRIDITTNQFELACFIVDKNSGKLKGITSNGRVIPFPDHITDWENPILSGVNASKLFTFSGDPRINTIMKELSTLKRDFIDLYRLIDGVDFSDKSYLTVTITGLPYRLRTTADSFAEQMREFVEFLEQFDPDMDSVSMIDMRFEQMIVSRSSK